MFLVLHTTKINDLSLLNRRLGWFVRTDSTMMVNNRMRVMIYLNFTLVDRNFIRVTEYLSDLFQWQPLPLVSTTFQWSSG